MRPGWLASESSGDLSPCPQRWDRSGVDNHAWLFIRGLEIQTQVFMIGQQTLQTEKFPQTVFEEVSSNPLGFHGASTSTMSSSHAILPD